MSALSPLTTTVATAVSDELSRLAERTRAGVVQVSDGRGGGAGTIWSSDGLIVTNHHVVPGDSAHVTLPDGRVLDGTSIAAMPERDLAILRVDATDLYALPSGDSSALRVGELVMAVGHPLGVRDAVSLGIFSGYGPIEHRGGRHFRESLMANIELRPGNSGGPLVNVCGEVVGINAMVIGRGTALAVPTSAVNRLLNGGKRRTLGVHVAAVATPREARLAGYHEDAMLMVLEVVRGSGAEHGALLPGDMLLQIAGQPIEEPADISWALAAVHPDEAFTTHVLRGGVRRELELRLATVS